MSSSAECSRSDRSGRGTFRRDSESDAMPLTSSSWRRYKSGWQLPRSMVSVSLPRAQSLSAAATASCVSSTEDNTSPASAAVSKNALYAGMTACPSSASICAADSATCRAQWTRLAAESSASSASWLPQPPLSRSHVSARASVAEVLAASVSLGPCRCSVPSARQARAKPWAADIVSLHRSLAIRPYVARAEAVGTAGSAEPPVPVHALSHSDQSSLQRWRNA